MTHHLKIWPHEQDAIERGEKTFEVRRDDDRDFAVGDVLHLHRWDPSRSYSACGHGAYIMHPNGPTVLREEESYTVVRRVTYVMRGGQFGLPPGICVMSLGPVEP